MLPVLLKLLHMPLVLEAVPQVLTDLLQQSPAMQKAANDSDAVSSLTTILHHEHTLVNRPRFKASSAFLAHALHGIDLAMVCHNMRLYTASSSLWLSNGCAVLAPCQQECTASTCEATCSWSAGAFSGASATAVPASYSMAVICRKECCVLCPYCAGIM